MKNNKFSDIEELIETLQGIADKTEMWPLGLSSYDRGIIYGLRLAIQIAEKQERKNEQKNG